MAKNSINPEVSNEQRYMALLALTSQELPTVPGADQDKEMKELNNLSSEEWEVLYRRLDADPAALEEFLKRRISTPVASQPRTPTNGRKWIGWKIVGEWMTDKMGSYIAWLFRPRVRYAVAFGLTAIAVMVVLVLQLPRSSPVTNVEQSFADVIFESDPGPLGTLVLPWEHSPNALGFSSAAGNDSATRRAFEDGLLRGKRRLSSLAQSVASGDASSARYTALGEWNVLLWAICESSQLPARDFWLRQRNIALELAEARYETEDAAVIAKHLAVVVDTITVLARGEDQRRSARRLAGELSRFREEFAPHDAGH